MIKARIKAENPKGNLGSYEKIYSNFSWSEADKEFSWHQTGRLNITHEAIDRWTETESTSGQPALIFENVGRDQTFTYGELKALMCRWANVLSELGFTPGDRLFIFLPPCPEIYIAMLACARLGVIFAPLYATLGYDELEERIRNGEPRGFLTHPDLAETLPAAAGSVDHVLFTQDPLPGLFARETLVPELASSMDPDREPEWLHGDSPLYLIYTSGSTGPPKGVVHGHGDMVGHLITGRYVLDLTEGSVLWTDGDPAWVTGTVYSTFAPWLCGAASVVQGNAFTASTWYRTLEQHRVTVWYTTPMTLRRLMEAGSDLPTRYDFSRLKHIASVGEALAPEQFYWVRKHLRHSPHDTWWMSECGMICLANFPTMDVKPGSMGKPVPGVEAAVLDEEGTPLPLLSMGELALKADWPCLMTTIWRDKDRYDAYFRFDGWFCTGDMAVMDEEGYYYHQGRVDDLIKVGEKLVGPYEIERILHQHPAVMEAAVISKGSAGGYHLKAFIACNTGATPSKRLGQEIKAYVKASLSPETPIKEVEFLDRLPKTSSGKILRRVLRARELGLPGGDPLSMTE